MVQNDWICRYSWPRLRCLTMFHDSMQLQRKYEIDINYTQTNMFRIPILPFLKSLDSETISDCFWPPPLIRFDGELFRKSKYSVNIVMKLGITLELYDLRNFCNLVSNLLQMGQSFRLPAKLFIRNTSKKYDQIKSQLTFVSFYFKRSWFIGPVQRNSFKSTKNKCVNFVHSEHYVLNHLNSLILITFLG